MPRNPKFQVRQTPSGWMVNVPGSLTNTGKRERHFHKTRDLAKAHAATLREKAGEHGSGASIIKPSLAEDATRAAAILSPWGLSLTEAAQRIAASLERESASKTIEEAGKAWIKSMVGLRERSIKSYEMTLKRMTSALVGRTLATLSADELVASITTKEGAGATYALHRRNARAFWNWSAKKGWCDKKIFENVDAPRKGEDKEITFLSPEEAKALLQTAEEAYPLAVPLYALALFAGIRAEELNRLVAEHVTLDGIELPAEVTKKGRRRHIVPNATLKAWLAVYPFVPCSNWRHVDCAVRRLTEYYQQQDDAAIVKLIQSTNLDTQLPEQPVLARLLHRYVEHRFTYSEWINEVKRICTNPIPRTAGYRGLATANDEHAISLTLAACLALRDPTLAGAVPYIAIKEHQYAAGAPPKVSVNETLRQFIGLVSDVGRSYARRLHEYLEVEEEYDRWIAEKIKSFKLKYRRNYDRVNFRNPKAREIAVSLRMAQEIAQHEKTRRGAQVKIYLEYQKRWWTLRRAC